MRLQKDLRVGQAFLKSKSNKKSIKDDEEETIEDEDVRANAKCIFQVRNNTVYDVCLEASLILST